MIFLLTVNNRVISNCKCILISWLTSLITYASLLLIIRDHTRSMESECRVNKTYAIIPVMKVIVSLLVTDVEVDDDEDGFMN